MLLSVISADVGRGEDTVKYSVRYRTRHAAASTGTLARFARIAWKPARQAFQVDSKNVREQSKERFRREHKSYGSSRTQNGGQFPIGLTTTSSNGHRLFSQEKPSNMSDPTFVSRRKPIESRLEFDAINLFNATILDTVPTKNTRQSGEYRQRGATITGKSPTLDKNRAITS